MARQVASSHSAISRGVASTGTSPERKCLGRVGGTDGELHLGAQTRVRPVSGGRRGGRRLGWAFGHGDYDTAVPPTALIEPDVLERVLSAALARGGDMAEVFAEDAATSAAMLDDGRIEELSSGRERGAGIRVVDGETTGFAHTADLSEPGLLAAAEAAAAVAREGGARRCARWRSAPAAGARARRPQAPPDTVAKATQARAARRGPTRRPGRPATPSPRCRPATATAAGASWSPTPTGCWPRTTRSAPAFNVVCVATGDTGMQTGYEAVARTEGFEIFDRVRRRGGGPDRGRAARWPSCRPGRRPRARCRSCWRAAAAASSSTRRAATGWRPTTS